ncbi:MAG: hypothetical protein Athens071416_332 [Parcubacteria group bacterium Athens0714_16]|nr:MAG: hypothetical protein Athens071416_332 [Parcubacteria group bacterium Athens0714_16]
MRNEEQNINDEENIELHELIEKLRLIYESKKEIRCPFFDSFITLNSDGFNHLLHKPNRQPRNVEEQKLKLKLLKRGLEIIKKTGTVQEYRMRIEKFGKPAKDGFTKTKNVEYWAFHDIVGEKKRFLLRVIIRRIGDGKLHFWSVMPHGKINKQKLYQEGIEDE